MRVESPIAIVCWAPPGRTETFIQAHVDHLPGNVLITGAWRPQAAGRPLLSWPRLAAHKGWRMMSGASGERQRTDAYVRAFRRHRTRVVLAEYGSMAVHVLPACRQLGIPLVAHFHGYDASHRGVLAEYRAGYAELFRDAAALVVVSGAMRARLIAMGAPPASVHYNAYGVDCARFTPGSPALAPPVILSVGRFTEKKAPQLILLAFAAVRRACPEARLRMVGEGDLLHACRDLALGLGIADAVTFTGALDPAAVAAEMRGARVFVQHSIQAPSGDCEGAPLSILEAGASALPVVSTRHGGIPDVVLDGATGYLVDEHDVNRTAAHLMRLVRDPDLAGTLGAAGRLRVSTCFSLEGSVCGLSAVLEAVRGAAARTLRETSVA
jgi:glycosyltransferase involved in cell wall biosynthesis